VEQAEAGVDAHNGSVLEAEPEGLTVEENVITSAKSRIEVVPCFSMALSS